MRRPAIALLASASLWWTGAAPAADLSPRAVSDYLAGHGPKDTVAMLTAGKGAPRWQAVLQGVKRGDARWLTVVKDLSSGTDAGTSEALQVSLATALPKNPGGVLRLVGVSGPLSVEQLCSAPFIEPSKPFLLRYLRQSRTALGRLDDREVETQRAACLRTIESTLSEQTATAGS